MKRIDGLSKEPMPFCATSIVNLFYNRSSRKRTLLLKIPITVLNLEEHDSIYFSVAHSYFQLFLYDLFISLNIVSPGCFDIFNWEIKNYGQEQLPQLHSFYFLMAREIIQNDFNIQIDNSIEKVISFIKKLYQNHDDLSDKAIVKALNTLMHFSLESHGRFNPESGLLLTYAIENLLGGGIPQSLLVKRLSVIIGGTENIKIKSRIKSIYDWRNKVVHGEYKLPHPGIYDVSDEFNLLHSEYFHISKYGFAAILLLAQVLLKNNSVGFCFTENYTFQD